MKIVVGLGNPGEKFTHTRHNAGFLALDYILHNDGFMEAKKSHEFKSETFTWQKDGKKIIFLKPQTFMNDSGQALKIICNFYKLSISDDLLVIHDDSDLALGTIKKTAGSSSAGHKGVQSIIDELKTQDFHRIRIGIETRMDKNIPPTDAFVLQNFTDAETKNLKDDILPKVYADTLRFLDLKE